MSGKGVPESKRVVAPGAPLYNTAPNPIRDADEEGSMIGHEQSITSEYDRFGSGFELTDLHEPTLPAGGYEDKRDQWASKVPRYLVVQSVKRSKAGS